MHRTGTKSIILLFLAAACVLASTRPLLADIQNDLGIMLIPQPAKLERLEGFFTIDSETAIAAGEGARGIAGWRDVGTRVAPGGTGTQR